MKTSKEVTEMTTGFVFTTPDNVTTVIKSVILMHEITWKNIQNVKMRVPESPDPVTLLYSCYYDNPALQI